MGDAHCPVTYTSSVHQSIDKIGRPTDRLTPSFLQPLNPPPPPTHSEQSVPLVIGQFNEMIDAHYGIVGSTAGSTYYVRTHAFVCGISLCAHTACVGCGVDAVTHGWGGWMTVDDPVFLYRLRVYVRTHCPVCTCSRHVACVGWIDALRFLWLHGTTHACVGWVDAAIWLCVHATRDLLGWAHPFPVSCVNGFVRYASIPLCVCLWHVNCMHGLGGCGAFLGESEGGGRNSYYGPPE